MKRKTFNDYFGFIVSALCVAFVTALFSAISFLLFESGEYTDAAGNVSAFDVTVIIDAGHGGEDGGAVGLSGSLEKDINLSVSKYLYEYISMTDLDVVMLREDDSMLYKAGQESRKKFHDLNNRVLMCKTYENPIFISIHQNKFPIEKYKGLQVYFSANAPDSKLFADVIQNKTKRFLQTDNNRDIKKAGRNIFVLDKLSCPAVLIECGFLSNPYDEKNLNDSEYQKKLAFIMFSSLMDYLTEKQLRGSV